MYSFFFKVIIRNLLRCCFGVKIDYIELACILFHSLVLFVSILLEFVLHFFQFSLVLLIRPMLLPFRTQKTSTKSGGTLSLKPSLLWKWCVLSLGTQNRAFFAADCSHLGRFSRLLPPSGQWTYQLYIISLYIILIKVKNCFGHFKITLFFKSSLFIMFY